MATPNIAKSAPELNPFDKLRVEAEWSRSLNPQQKQAVEAQELPLLIAAGAGTGKTKTLTSRLVYLLRKGVPAHKICALTFTNKAANEMAERVEAMVKGQWSLRRQSYGASATKVNGPFIGTFHSLGAKILRKEYRFFGRTGGFVIFDDHDSFQLVKKIIKGLGEDAHNKGPAVYVQKISAVKNGALRSQELKEAVSALDRMAWRVLRRYEEKLKECNAFDFDDLIQKVVLLWKKNPDIRKKYERRFSHILVDEYQDLNAMQYEMVRFLIAESRKLSVVGDDQQMIYGWRYANLETFLNFGKDWPEAQLVLLEENYRSSGNIIRAAQAVISKNQRQQPKTLWTRNAPGELVRLVEMYDEDNEAEWIAEQIRNEKLEMRNEATAVLYRTNAQSRALEQALLEREIPYRVFGGVKFYERREIKDVLAALRVIANPRDAISYERLERAFSKRKARELVEHLSSSHEAEPREVITRFIREVDYFAYLERNFLNADERRENIGELLHFAARFSALLPFLEEVSLLQATDTVERNEKLEMRNEVHLMTIHLAKGLEFDQVFVAGCTEGLLPHARSMDSEAELEEERRLMYVAMTRAKHELALSFYDQPSRFLSEIPEELLRFESLLAENGPLENERYITLD